MGLSIPLLAAALAAAVPACPNGAYKAAGGNTLALATATPQSGKTTQRYAFLDGRVGFLGEPNAPVCRDGAMTDGATAYAPVALHRTPAHFASAGVTLSGLLVEPAAAAPGAPLVVLVHGSERYGSVAASSMPYVLAAQGIASFVYDKRGTGESGGAYTQNFETLAADVVAASAEARRLADGRYGRFGLFGGSQGGWVAPLAAQTVKPDFVVVGYGLVLSPLEEDSEQVFDELRRRNAPGDVLAAAREVTDATGAVIASHFTAGFEDLARVKARYADAPWLNEIRGEFTGDILAMTEDQLRRDGPARLDDLGVLWRYDSMPVLRGLAMPQLWVLAGADREAPGTLTRERLAVLRKEGRPIEVTVYPDTDHGIYEFVTLPDGSRKATKVADGYFRLVADWMKGESHPPYGAAVPGP
ncbi:MAG: alpha/beta hydrolase [Alphaproteobacteria bacterium]|nr:alpha/beta hydrolase [Alphaproteobacteria bacterium]